MGYFSHKCLIKNLTNKDILGIDYPDAVFIMLCRRSKYFTSNKLKILRALDRPIFFLGSCDQDQAFYFRSLESKNSNYLSVFNSHYLAFLAKFKTRSHQKTKDFCLNWDLDMKRNFAMLVSLDKGYRKVLLLDDDILGFDLNHLTIISQIGEEFCMVGSFPEEFPDTSVLGHLCRVVGLREDIFLSGSFLLINLTKCVPFFPGIYNEDWLAMVPAVRERGCASYGVVQQEKYDPFLNLSTVYNQEFGDLLAEGVYLALHLNSYFELNSISFWNNCILERMEVWESLNKKLANNNSLNMYDGVSMKNSKNIIKSGLEILDDIKPEDCVTFFEDWCADQVTWSEKSSQIC